MKNKIELPKTLIQDFKEGKTIENLSRDYGLPTYAIRARLIECGAKKGLQRGVYRKGCGRKEGKYYG